MSEKVMGSGDGSSCAVCVAFVTTQNGVECPVHGLPDALTSKYILENYQVSEYPPTLVPRFLAPPDWDSFSLDAQKHLLFVKALIETRSGKTNHAGLFGRFEEIEKLLELTQSSIENRIGVEGSATQSCIQSLTEATEALERVLQGVSIGLSSKLEATNDKIVDLQSEVIRLQKAQNKVLLYLIANLGINVRKGPLASIEEAISDTEAVAKEVEDMAEVFGD